MSAASPLRNLTCTDCGSFAGFFTQHGNQDAGHGICRPCIGYVQAHRRSNNQAFTGTQLIDLYGVEGTHYATKEQWHEIQNRN
jgi:hypothetical protein